MHYVMHFAPSYISIIHIFKKILEKKRMTKFSNYSLAMTSISKFAFDLIYSCAIHTNIKSSLEKT